MDFFPSIFKAFATPTQTVMEDKRREEERRQEKRKGESREEERERRGETREMAGCVQQFWTGPKFLTSIKEHFGTPGLDMNGQRRAEKKSVERREKTREMEGRRPQTWTGQNCKPEKGAFWDTWADKFGRRRAIGCSDSMQD